MEYATQRTRELIWHRLWRVNRIIRYCEALQSKYVFRGKLIKLLVVIPAIGSVMTAFTKLLPDVFQVILSAVVGITAAYSLFANYEKKASVFYLAHSECLKIESEYDKLWTDMENRKKSNDEVLETNYALQERLNDIIIRSDNHDIPENKRINRRCAEDAKKALDSRYKYNSPEHLTHA